jgi:hypothetical protein
MTHYKNNLPTAIQNPTPISISDAGNYFRGLLVLARKDRKVTQAEMELMLRIGRSLALATEFCEMAIRDLLENDHITETPPAFATQSIAVKFLRDGLALAYSDKDAEPAEERWLEEAARANNLHPDLFMMLREHAIRHRGQPLSLEADNLVVQHKPGGASITRQ